MSARVAPAPISDEDAAAVKMQAIARGRKARAKTEQVHKKDVVATSEGVKKMEERMMSNKVAFGSSDASGGAKPKSGDSSDRRRA